MNITAKIPINTDAERTYGGMIFEKTALEKAIDEYNKRVIKLGQIWGKNSYKNHLILSELSHKINDLVLEDDGVKIDIETLDTPKGKCLEEIVKSGHNIKPTPVWFGNIDNTNIPDITRIDIKFDK